MAAGGGPWRSWRSADHVCSVGQAGGALARISSVWVPTVVLIIVLYSIVFAVFKLVSQFFPTRVLGIIGVLTASVGLLMEMWQYGAALSALEGRPATEGLNSPGLVLTIFYGAVLLGVISLFRAAFAPLDEESKDNDQG